MIASCLPFFGQRWMRQAEEFAGGAGDGWIRPCSLAQAQLFSVKLATHQACAMLNADEVGGDRVKRILWLIWRLPLLHCLFMLAFGGYTVYDFLVQFIREQIAIL